MKTAENSAVPAGPAAAISIATNMATKTWKKSLRTLSAAQLTTVAGGIIIYDSTSLSTVESDPASTTSVGDGLREAAIMFWR